MDWACPPPGADPAGDIGRRHRLGRMERAGFFQSASARKNGPCLAEYGATRPAAARLEAALLTLDSALPPIRAVVCAASGGGLRAFRHVRLRRYHFGIARGRLAGHEGETGKESGIRRFKIQNSRLKIAIQNRWPRACVGQNLLKAEC